MNRPAAVRPPHRSPDAGSPAPAWWPSDAAGRWEAVLLGAVVLLAAAVRLASIGSRLNYDEAYSWYTASAPTLHVFLARLADNENTPPLIYLVMGLVPRFTPAWMRMVATVPGVLLSPVLYLALRPRLGGRCALLAALGVAVDPYLVTYSDFARGFMLADLALLVALWCLLSLAERERPAAWVGFVLAGVIAVYTEYISAVVLGAMLATALALGRPRRRSTVAAGVAVGLALGAWIPEIVRSQNQVGLTKFDPINASPSLGALRDMVTSLALGEHGGTSSTAGRLLIAFVLLAAGAGAAVVLRRSWSAAPARERYTLTLLAGTGGLCVLGAALAALVGVDVFTPRYLTVLVPLAAGVGSAAVVATGSRALLTVAVVALSVLGLANTGRRLGAQYGQDMAPVARAAAALHPRAVITNTPMVLYYLRSPHPIFDRPYDIGPGLGGTCARPCLAVDDIQVVGGTPRAIAGRQQLIGHYLLTLEP